MDKLHEIIASQRAECINGSVARQNHLAALSTSADLSAAAVILPLPNPAGAGPRVSTLMRAEFGHE